MAPLQPDIERWLRCYACGAPMKGSADCNCQQFTMSREELIGFTKALASSSVPEELIQSDLATIIAETPTISVRSDGEWHIVEMVFDDRDKAQEAFDLLTGGEAPQDRGEKDQEHAG